MGKRQRRRNLRKSCEDIPTEEDKEMKFFLTTDLVYFSDDYHGCKVLKQVTDCIDEIYSEHIHDLEQRKAKRIESKTPTEYFQPYNLVVNSAFQSRIKSYIEELKPSKKIQSFKDSLVSSTEVFIEYLQKQVKEFDGKKALLQAIMLYESFHTLQNAITQVGAITDDLISKREFDLMLKEKFKRKISDNYLELLETVLKKEQSEYLDDLERMKKTLEGLNNEKETCLDYCSTIYSESCSDEDANIEAFHNLPIDELVKIITQDSKKKKKGKRKNRGSTESSSSPKRDEIDFEIEEFRKRLEGEKATETKNRPLVSDEFLEKLKSQIKQNMR